MRTFNATETNDLALSAADNFQVISSVEAIGQAARQAMQTRRGEMIHDVQGGIPFDIVAWEGTPNIPQFEAAARRRLRAVAGVREIISFEASLTGDVLTYVTVLQTDEGEVTVNGL